MKWTGRLGALALVGFVLAGSGIAAASVGKPTVQGRPATHLAPGKRPGTIRVLPAGAPKGYIVVNSGALTAANGTQTFGSAACPAKTVVYGGGVIITSSSLAANVNTSWPDGDTDWAADVNNASGAATTFTVYAICAHKPKGYKVIESGGVVNPAGSQNVAVAYCPSGLKVFGGGGYSTSGSTSVNMNTSIPASLTHPKRYVWGVVMNNASTGDATVYAYAICGKVKGYKLKVGSIVANPAGAETRASVTCPSGTVPLGGGVASNSSSTAVNINSTWPDGTEWGAYENNGDSVDHTIIPYVTCAA